MRVLLVILLFQSFSGLTASVPSDKHWSWQPLENSRVPAANRHSNPIDAFIVAHLKTKGLALAPRADRRTDTAGIRGTGHLGGDRCDNDQIEIRSLHAGILECALEGITLKREGGFLSRRADATLCDSSALTNPLIRGVHHFFKVKI